MKEVVLNCLLYQGYDNLNIFGQTNRNASVPVIIKPVANPHGILLIWGGTINVDLCFVLVCTLSSYRYILNFM